MKKTQGNSGGPRAGSQCQEIFADLLQFSAIWGGDGQTPLIFENLRHTRKNFLTFLAFALIMAQGGVDFLLMRGKTWLN